MKRCGRCKKALVGRGELHSWCARLQAAPPVARGPLAAAAPELLDLAREVAAILKTAPFDSPLSKRLRAAIAKAEGRSS